ncbi:hypothetical protein JTE90_016643 [Oedothorax gibbosus]|uniref:Uncharacterized protein n=1 Tax=Oedothorax gibbosus TaxID=931172 RepID=A0AAV6TYE2_9ARAC|nr:hypothetical protein JTE90_016643 [Oedothorax gibbosus]
MTSSSNNSVFAHVKCPLGVAALTILCCSLLCETRAQQQFYPNGRYGRRSVLPPLAESTQDFRVAVSADDSMMCRFTGYADFYRCTIKEISQVNQVLK